MRLLALATLLLMSAVGAEESYYTESISTKRGFFAKIVNDTQYELTCVIDNFEIDVPAYSESIFYPVDSKEFYWECR